MQDFADTLLQQAGLCRASVFSLRRKFVGAQRVRYLVDESCEQWQLFPQGAVLRLVDTEPWRRWQLQANAAQLRARLAMAGIATDPSRTPRALELRGAGARGNAGIVAGIAIFAITQKLVRSPL